MKKLIFKTIILTLAVVVILAMSVFGIMSLLAPTTMMDLTFRLGLTQISGDYAYQEYERSHDIYYLARSFIISADAGHNRTAEKRFDLLLERQDFSEFCEEQDKATEKELEKLPAGIPPAVREYTYRGYVFGLGAFVKYRLAGSDEARESAIELAIEETAQAFPSGNSTVVLAVKAAEAKDTGLCTALIARMEEAEFEDSALYQDIVHMLEEAV